MKDKEIERLYVMGSFISTELDAFEILHNELEEKGKKIEKLNNKEEQLIRKLEDLIIVGEQVENEWAVDICKMIIKELKGSDK